MTMLKLKRTVLGAIPDVLERVTVALQREGFGNLTRIDFHQKLKELFGREVAPVVILGAGADDDAAAFSPWNVVLRQLCPGKISIEIVKPLTLKEFFREPGLTAVAAPADALLARALASLAG